jgi:hypothetical protein
MNVVDLVQPGTVREVRPGDTIVIAGGARLKVASCDRADSPIKLVVGGPDKKTAVGINLVFDNGDAMLVHPSDAIGIIRS